MARLRDAVLALAALAARTAGTQSLELSGQELTNITAGSNATAFSFYSNGTLVSEVSAQDLSLETELLLQNNALASIPATFFQAARNLTFVNISDNPLTELETKSFAGLSYLQEVWCTNTQVAVLPSRLVSDCPVLEVLRFNNNSIRVIESQALVNLPKLEIAELSWNNVTTLYDDSLVNLSALHTLDLRYNQLKRVPEGLLTASSSWQALDFAYNDILEVPTGIQSAVVEGYISFNHNLLVEIESSAFADAPGIRELRLASNAIFTIHSQAFSGMAALRILDLSDNVISVVDEDAFEDLDGLEELKLGDNQIHRLTLSSVPANLQRLELQNNLMDLMPDLPDDTAAANLESLNLSQNYLWSLSSNDALDLYTGLEVLDVSHNRLINFTAMTFDPILSSISAMHFDYNLITSIPQTTFVSLLTKLLTNVTFVDNPGIGWTQDVALRSDCPNGSVFEAITMPSSSTANLTLYGCIQCLAGTYHDNSTGSCVPCSDVSARAFADQDGATVCKYCPYSSDLLANRKVCVTFTCNLYCWFTLSLGICIPSLVFGSKLLLYVIMKSSKRTRKIDIKEQEDMNDWRMGVMLHQLTSEPSSPRDSLLDDDVDLDASVDPEQPVRIYDLPEETKDVVLDTLREYFRIRKEKRFRALPEREQEATREWNDVEWETFHMHRILSRSYHGEVFLGDYCGTHVVVKRMMTLRFEVKELADTISDVEMLTSLHHPNVVTYLGTMWTDPEHLCVISEYVKGGDLAALLEVEAIDRVNANVVAAAARVSQARELANLTDLSGYSDETTPTPTLARMYGASAALLAVRFQMALDICEALAYVHDLGFSHSDLRSRNVMVTELFRCKLGDFRHHSRDDTHFGTSVCLVTAGPTAQRCNSEDSDEDGVDMESVRFLQPEQHSLLSPSGPTLPLVAPEVLHHNSRHLGADIYSFGILLLEMLFHPYVSFQNDQPDDYDGGRRRRKKSKLVQPATAEDAPQDKNGGAANQEQPGLSRTASVVQKGKKHNAVVRHFMSKLRVLANIGGGTEEADQCSFGTTPTSSAASLSLSSTCVIVDKLSTAIEDCLQSDPKKRPNAKKLAELFRLLLDEINTT